MTTRTHRPRQWADIRYAGVVIAATAVNKFDLLLGTPTVDTLTVTRIIGDLTIQYRIATTLVDSLSIVDVGIGVTSVEAFAAGGSSLPNPSIQSQYPPRGWLYVDSQPVAQKAESTGVIERVARFQFDLKGQRKIDKGILYMIIEQNDITVGGAMEIIGRTRVLCLA